MPMSCRDLTSSATARSALAMAEELATLAAYVCHYGMFPSAITISVAGRRAVHSTAFRPIDDAALARNPFRILPRCCVWN